MNTGDRAGRALIIDDDPDILTAARMTLRRRFDFVAVCNTPDAAMALIASSEPFDVIMLDMNFRRGANSSAEGLALIDRILAIDAALPIVCVTAHGELKAAVEAMKRGAFDFLMKPWENEKLIATMAAAAKFRAASTAAGQWRQCAQTLAKAPYAVDEPVALSAAMRALMQIAERAAPTEANILALGEHGAGKEVLARAIHERSARSEGPFVTVDLGAISDQLAESELFGHVRGAYTDAKDSRAGRVTAAEGGTLFLDEIGNASPALQAKLLTLLERREITAVGADTARSADVRIIAATNADNLSLRDPAVFRQDLLYRINTVELKVPPLRDRRDDILPLSEIFLEGFARKYSRHPIGFSGDAQAALMAHDWPGNVRALRHAVERAIILSEGSEISVADLALENPRAAETGAESETLHAIEKNTISDALRKFEGNVSRAARALGLTRASLYRRMKKHDL